METLTHPVEWGAATVTLAGQVQSGDRYVVVPSGSGVLVAAIDGLGHGVEAASAAQLAAGVLERDPRESVITLVRRCHERLRETRGVVMSLASFNALDETMTWLGVLKVVDDMSIRPAGRNPLSRSSSVSYPTVYCPRVAVCPGARFATAVFRQNRNGA